MRFLLLIAISCLFTVNSFAQTELPQTASQPSELFKNGYLDLPESLRVNADVDNKIIRYFFDFSCVYCRSIKDVMQVWSTTIPGEYTFVYHHVSSNTAENYQVYYLKAATMTYISNLDIPNSAKHRYMNNIFEHVNKVSTPEMMMRLVKESATDIKIDISLLGNYLTSKESIDNYRASIELQRQIGLSQTPTILIAGRFLTHLGLADGKPDLWIELINKVTSIHFYLGKQQNAKLSSN
jgi:hypothetical protein